MVPYDARPRIPTYLAYLATRSSGHRVGQLTRMDELFDDSSTYDHVSAFRGYRFPDDIIALAVRWYLRFRVPSTDVVELLAAQGVPVGASTVFDGVQRFTPLLSRCCWRILKWWVTKLANQGMQSA